jgi:hypothetical protein
MKTFILSSIILLAVIAFSSCTDEETLTETSFIELKSTVLDSTCTESNFTTTVEDLTEADIAGLLLMREEEKMAHDVYVYFFEKYGLTIFDRISNSESKHAESVLRLIEHFELADPTIAEAGVFANEELQALYNELIAIGDESVEAALAAGALIEETDIEDLQILIDGTENADILTVYGKLLNGSFNHLKGFVRTLSSYDVTYEPQILTQEVFEAILATPNGNGSQGNRGNGGHGNGNSKGGGQGGNGNQGGQGGSNGQGSGNGTGTCVNG